MSIMRYSTLLVLVATVAIAKAQSSESSGSDEGERIVGGSTINIASARYQVALLGSNGGQFCGGSIIGPDWILTAAHCFGDNDRPSSYRVRVGSHFPTSGGQVVTVSYIVRHPSFSMSTFDNDIALLKVSPISFNANTAAVSLPPRNSGGSPATGLSMWATGFGRLSSGGSSPRQLQGVYVTVVDFNQCRRRYNLTPRMFCAGDSGKDTCQGDSGGPIVNNGVQYGITSFGEGCAKPGVPGVYANVMSSDLRNYIYQNTGI